MTSIDKEQFEFVTLDSAASETIDAPTYSYWKSVFKQFFSRKSTFFMLAILIAIIVMSFVYPLFVHCDFTDVSDINDFSKRYVWPNSHYWFGTDKDGRSLFDCVWYGARSSILISVIATVLNMIIGVVIVTMVSQLLPSYISYEAFLSYFGIGLPITDPSLGRLISNYSSNLTSNAYLFWIPLTILVLVSLPLYIVGQNLADASDPRTHR